MSKRILFSGIFLLLSAVFVCGQNPQPNPTPVGRNETTLQKIRRQDRADQRIQQQAYSNLYGQGSPTNNGRNNSNWREKMVTLYRKPSKKETVILKPSEAIQQNYKQFLQNEKTGIVKLIPDQGCENDGKTVNASPNCLNYQFPGAGSSFSFRLKSYRMKRLADITLVKNSLRTRSIFNGAMYVVLGNVPIETVNLNTEGINYLAKYKPVKTSKEALDSAKRIARGIKKDGYIYGRGVFATKNLTFAMRSIAYRGKYKRAESGVVYNELNFDKRRDLIVAFRIVEVDKKGAVTLVWKILKESKSPKLKAPQKDK